MTAPAMTTQEMLRLQSQHILGLLGEGPDPAEGSTALERIGKIGVAAETLAKLVLSTHRHVGTEECEHQGDLVLTDDDLEVTGRLMRQYSQWHLGDPTWGEHFMTAVTDPLTLRQSLAADKRS